MHFSNVGRSFELTHVSGAGISDVSRVWVGGSGAGVQQGMFGEGSYPAAVHPTATVSLAPTPDTLADYRQDVQS